MKSAAIVTLCVAASVLYGILHDMVTTRVCLEYFTVFHPRVIASEDPTLLALTWGVIATWWMGAGLGVVLALAAPAGERPKMDVPDLVRPVGFLLLIMGAGSLLAGFAGYFGSRAGWWRLTQAWSSKIPRGRHDRFLADLWAHNAAYGLGFFGGLGVIAWAWFERRRRGARHP